MRVERDKDQVDTGACVLPSPCGKSIALQARAGLYPHQCIEYDTCADRVFIYQAERFYYPYIPNRKFKGNTAAKPLQQSRIHTKEIVVYRVWGFYGYNTDMGVPDGCGVAFGNAAKA